MSHLKHRTLKGFSWFLNYHHLYVSMYGHHLYVSYVWSSLTRIYVWSSLLWMYVWSSHIARVWINWVKLPILLVISSTGKMNISLSPFAPEDLVSRDGLGSPVPRQPAYLHTLAESGAYLRDPSPFPRRRPFIYTANCHGVSHALIVHQVTSLRTDGVHCR